MSAFALRMLAILFMVIDHTACLASGMPAAPYLLLRALGRVSFPIFAYLTANGFRHTRSVPRYALRLLFWALLSECPFDFAFSGAWFAPDSQNVFFTLLLGLLAIAGYDAASRLRNGQLLGAAVVLALAAAADLLRTDYGFAGVLLIAGFHRFGGAPRGRALCCLVFGARKVLYLYLRQLVKLFLGRADLCFLPTQWEVVTLFAACALLPLALYNERRGYTPTSRAGRLAVQYAAYAFYPAHLLVLALLFRL